MDAGELIPVMGIALLGVTTTISIVGAYALGKGRRREDRAVRADPELTERIDRVERMLETMAVEIERFGDGQRFLVKIMAEKQLGPNAESPRSPGRVVTPH